MRTAPAPSPNRTHVLRSVPVEEAAEQLHADDEHVPVHAAPDEAWRSPSETYRKPEQAACRSKPAARVAPSSVATSTLVAGSGVVRRAGADDDEVELGGVEAGDGQRVARGVARSAWWSSRRRRRCAARGCRSGSRSTRREVSTSFDELVVRHDPRGAYIPQPVIRAFVVIVELLGGVGRLIGGRSRAVAASASRACRSRRACA